MDAPEMPLPEHPVGQRIGYHLRTGKHDVVRYDWLQYLKFVDRENILALSPDSMADWSYLRHYAAGLAQVRPTAENVLLLQPTLVVRSYGGGPHITRYLERWLPHFARSNRSYMTVALGCTGGQHRSVYLCERLLEHFRLQLPRSQLRHRELNTPVGATP